MLRQKALGSSPYMIFEHPDTSHLATFFKSPSLAKGRATGSGGVVVARCARKIPLPPDCSVGPLPVGKGSVPRQRTQNNKQNGEDTMKKINLFNKTISPLSDGKGCPVERGGVWELPRRTPCATPSWKEGEHKVPSYRRMPVSGVFSRGVWELPRRHYHPQNF